MYHEDRPLTAQEVLARYWDNSIPVNPIEIAESMGVEVYKSNEFDVDGEFLFYEGRPSIIYRPSGNTRRDRFTVAHELGHFCLRHGPRYRDPRKNFSLSNYDLFERDANMFAAELLMPEEVVQYAVRVSEMQDVEEMCEYFDVSGAAMRIRLERLGYLR